MFSVQLHLKLDALNARVREHGHRVCGTVIIDSKDNVLTVHYPLEQKHYSLIYLFRLD